MSEPQVEAPNFINPSVPEPTLRRLPGYLCYFQSLQQNHLKYISSSVIAHAFKIDPTLVTKDLSYTGVKGRTKVGYSLETLIEAIVQFLKFNQQENAFLFGVGNLGKALLQYDGLRQHGIKIVACFDIHPKVINTTVAGLKVYPLQEFRDLSRKIPARLGVITTPDNKAQETADLLVAWGMKAIWNFTPQSIKVPEKIVVVNTNIYADLAVILHRLKQS